VNPIRSGLVLVGAVLVSLSLPGEVLGQSGAQERLASTAGQLAQAWAMANDRTVTAHLAVERISLNLEGEVSVALSQRHATAAVRDYLRGFERGEVTVVRVELAGDASSRGFAQLRWTARRVGTGQPLTYTVFLGVRETPTGWSIDEIRVMR
jgi:hypothetical protein